MNSRNTTVTSARRSTIVVPSTSGATVPTTSRAATTSALKSSPTQGLRRLAWILRTRRLFSWHQTQPPQGSGVLRFEAGDPAAPNPGETPMHLHAPHAALVVTTATATLA